MFFVDKPADFKELSIENTICELRDPVAQDHEPAGGRYRLIDHHMDMPEHEIIDRRIHIPIIILGEDCKRLAIHASELGLVLKYIAIMRAPQIRQGHCPPRMYGGIQLLAQLVAEQPTDKPEPRLQAPYAIAMVEEKFLAHYLPDLHSIDHTDAELVAKIVEKPYVVIAYEPCDPHSRISKRGQSSKKPHIAPGDYGAILEPVIEHIAHQVYFRCRVTYRLQKSHDAELSLTLVLIVCRSKMKVAQEICIFAIGHNTMKDQRNPSSSLASSLIMS